MVELPTVSGGRGPRFIRHTGTAMLLRLPAGEAIVTPEALVEDELHRGASFLVSRTDVDAGEAPETLLTRLATLGVRAVIAPGFERVFYERSAAYCVLPAIVDESLVGELADRVASEDGVRITVDLEEQTISSAAVDAIRFEVDARMRNKLLLGLSDLDEALRYTDTAAALRSADRKRRPWLYDPS